jgi:cobalt-zinc-cadmium efflux system outer membrane protein
LPGERSRLGSLAEAESKAVTSRATAAQLRTAAAVRDAWWLWQRAKSEQALARERLNNAQRLAGDVARRVKAGDLAKSDIHQAEGAAATAEVGLAEADAALTAAIQRVRAITGALPADGAVDSPETVPAVPADFTTLDSSHPAVVELFDRAEVARRVADLARVQTRNNPELVLATTRDRGGFDDAYQQTVTFGLRIPFGSESRNQAKVGQARAEVIETEGLLRLERERLAADLEATRSRLESARAQLTAAEKRARLARESRGFFDKSFRLGESDLPTRLRIEFEAAEAERQAGRARIDLAAAISALRQALGLLPE